MRSRLAFPLVVSLVALAPAEALAGPPLLCFPMSIGNAPSLPWGTGGWNSPRADYDRTRLARDTVALLGPSAPVLVRMETLRRAVIYASSDAAATRDLLTTLRTRAGGAKDKGTDPLALFDLGYAVETFRQARHATAVVGSSEPAEDGYALIRRAIALRSTDPEMEYAAALVSSSRTFRGVSDQHLRAALAGARDDTSLGRTIAAHQPLWGSRLAELRASAAH